MSFKTFLKYSFAVAVCFLCAPVAQGQTVTVNGLTFRKAAVNDYVMLTEVTAELPEDVVVPSTVTIGNKVYDVCVWADEALSPKDIVPVDRVRTIRSQDGTAPLTMNNAISGWSQLREIRFPVNLTKVDCDFINYCPALESVTLSSPQPVTFQDPYLTTNVVLASRPVLYVPADLVEAYKTLRDNTAKDNYARYFLSQTSDIRPIGGAGQDEPARMVVDGIEYTLDSDKWVCYVSGYDEQTLGAEALIQPRLEINDEEYPVEYIASGALAAREGAPVLQTLTIGEGSAGFGLEQGAIAGWTDLTLIDMPANTARIDAGALARLPELETIIIRSNSAVEITGADSEPEFPLESNPVLKVPAAMVDVYNELLDEGDGPTRRFLSQMSAIESLEGPAPEDPVVTVRYEDTFITLHDAAAGHRLHFSSRTGRALHSLYNNGEDHTERLDDGMYVIPETDSPTLLHVTFEPAN